MRRLAFIVLAACSSTISEPPPSPEPPTEALAPCSPGATLTLNDVAHSKTGLLVARVMVSNVESGTNVTPPRRPQPTYQPPKEPLLPAVAAAFREDKIDPSPRETQSSRPGFFATIGHLIKGAVAGLTNLVLMPMTLPLHLIDSRVEVFPISWNAGALGDAYPTARMGPLFDDSVLAPADHAPKKAAFDAFEQARRAASDQAEKRTVDAYGSLCLIGASGACTFEYFIDPAATEFPVALDGINCSPRALTAKVPEVPPPAPQDVSKGSALSVRAWNESFGTRAPQLVAAQSAVDAYKLAQATTANELKDTTVVCSVETRRAADVKKKSLLTARFSFGDLMAAGVSVQARRAGEPLVFVVPHVFLESGGSVKIAVIDAQREWGGAAIAPYEGTLPLVIDAARFTAECRALTAEVTRELAAQSLERMRAIPDLDAAAFTLAKKSGDERQAARMKLVDSVRDVEALVGRKNDTAKAAQAFAEGRFAAWKTRIAEQVAPLLEKATPAIAVKGGTLNVTKVSTRYQACSVTAMLTPQKAGRFSLEAALKELMFVDRDGVIVEPHMLTPDEPVKVKADEPLEVKFDVPAKTTACGVGVAKSGEVLKIEVK